MRFKTFFPVVFAVFVLFFLPSIAIPVDDFHVYTHVDYYDGSVYYWDDDEPANGPPLPISSYKTIGDEDQWAYGESKIDATPTGFSMEVHASAENNLVNPSTYSSGDANAGYYNYSFVATGPILQFSYDFDYNIYAEGFDSDAYASHEVGASLEVYYPADGEGEGDTIFNDEFIYYFLSASGVEANSDNNTGSGQINIPLTPGEEYQIYLEIYEYAYAEGYALGGGGRGELPLASLSLNVETSVLPEPISSILFITGGATLGLRRFWKKRRTA